MMAHVRIERTIEMGSRVRASLSIVAALAVGSLLALVLEAWIGLADASSVYLLAVAAVAIAFGTIPAVVTAAGSFVVYNFLFIDPRLSLLVAGPQELLTLFLLLGLGILIGRLAGLQRDRARQASEREREARALFAISRLFAMEPSTEAAMAEAVRRLAADARMDLVWVGLGATEAQERTVAISESQAAVRLPGTHAVLRREADEGRATWARIHPPVAERTRTTIDEPAASVYRVALAAGGVDLGSLWAQRPAGAHLPSIEETRLLAATADQIGQALQRERLARQALELELTRRSDELKTALLVSVSHDLRTPLAAIRASSGNIADPAIEMTADERRAAAAAIDEEAQRLDRLVGNLIDMSRIEGRDLAPELEAIPLGDAVESVVDRLRPSLADRPLDCIIPGELPPVRADATLLDQVLANLLENVVRHTPPGTPLHIEARPQQPSGVLLVVEDGGPGVSDEALPHLFERFYRGDASGSRTGSGLGLAVVRGFVEAMGGRVAAGRSAVGGLRIELQLATDPGIGRRRS